MNEVMPLDGGEKLYKENDNSYMYKDLSNVTRTIPKVINDVKVLSLYLPKVKGKCLMLVTECIHCGKPKDTRVTDLKNNKSKSCTKCCNVGINNGRFTHGGNADIKGNYLKTKLFTTFNNMHRRAGKIGGNYENVSVCKEWNSFDNFYVWALRGYKPGLTLDKDKYYYLRGMPDSAKVYGPYTCNWLTRKEQNLYRDNHGRRKLKRRLNAKI